MKRMPIYLVLRGGLGNQLFMFASTYSAAKKSNRKLQLITNWYEEQTWESVIITNRRFLELYEFTKIKEINTIWTKKISIMLYYLFKFTWKFGQRIVLNICTDIDDRVKPIKAYWPLIVHGYMQNQKNFELERPELKKLFKTSEELELSLSNYMESFRTNGKRLIALHVRRGDNLKNNGPEYRLNMNYYEKCLSRLNYSAHEVVVFSDEIEWCKIQFQGRGFHFINELSPVKSLILLSHCDDYILSVSTFSWWGAWLSDSLEKTVLVPKISESKSHWNNLAEKNWIQMEAIFEQSR